MSQPLHPKVSISAHRYTQANSQHPLQIGFSSAHFHNEDSYQENNMYHLLDILVPGLIFEVVVINKDTQKGQLNVILHRFLAFSDLVNKQKEVDMSHFKKFRERLQLLIKVDLFQIAAQVDENEVIEDFSMFQYYIHFSKLVVGDHLNAVITKINRNNKPPTIAMTLRNKVIQSANQWSLLNLQDPKTFEVDFQMQFRLGYTKMYAKSFQANRSLLQEQSIIQFESEHSVFPLDYQIQNDVFFENKSNYDMMLQSLQLQENKSFLVSANVELLPQLKVNFKKLGKLSLGGEKEREKE